MSLFRNALIAIALLQGASAANVNRAFSMPEHFLQAADAETASLKTAEVAVIDKQAPATDYTSLAIGIGLGALVGAAIAGGVLAAMGKKGAEEPKDAAEDEAGVEDLEPVVEEKPEEVASASGATDYQRLIKVVAQKVAQEVGPKLSKAGAVRNVLNSRMADFGKKSKSFLLNEIGGTAGSVLKQMDAPEAMLMLDWDHAVEANFPPASILLAGILSPSVISLMSFHHLVQMVTVGLPILVLCICAIYIDQGSPCSIPTIFAWLYTQTALSACLVVGHGALFVQILMGKKALAAKTLEIEENKKNAKDDVSGIRDEFVANTMVLQEALLIENNIRHSFWNTIVGLATFLWLLTTIWNLVLIIGWTFVPGVVAFHPDAAEVAKHAYCGTWMTVLVLRINMLLAVLYLFFNLATVVQWFCDMMIESPGFQKTVLGEAQKMDQNASGLPVVELFVKAFLLRGSSDTLNSRLAVVQNNKSVLEKEKAELEAQLNAITSDLTATGVEEDALKAQAIAGGGDIAVHVAEQAEKANDMKNWKENAAASVDEAEAKALEVRQATTAALEELLEKIKQAVDAVQNSETAKAMMAKARELEAQLEAKMNEAMDTLNDPEFQQKMMDAANQAADQAKDMADQAVAAAKDPELQKKLNAAAHDAMEKAQAAAQDVAAAANDPEMQKKLQQAMADAQAAAAEAAAGLNDPEMQKKIQAAAQNAMDQAQLAAESAIAAAQDPELRKKLREAAQNAQDNALAKAQEVAEAVEKAKKEVEAAANDPALKEKLAAKLKDIREAAEKAKEDATAAATQKAQEVAEAVEKAKKEVEAAANDPELKAKLEAKLKEVKEAADKAKKDATAAATKKAQEVTEAVEKAKKETEAALNDPALKAKLEAKIKELKDAAEKAKEEAKAAGAKAAEAAQDPEMQKKLAAAAKKYADDAKKAAGEAAAAVQDPELLKKLQEAAQNAQAVASAKAQEVAEAVEKVKKEAEAAANDPVLKANLEAKVKELQEVAEKAKQDAEAAAAKAAEAARS